MQVGPSASTSSHPFPVGVVVGTLGAVVIVVGICAFTWYKVKARRQKTDSENGVSNEGGNQKIPVVEEMDLRMEQTEEDPFPS